MHPQGWVDPYEPIAILRFDRIQTFLVFLDVFEDPNHCLRTDDSSSLEV